MREVDRKGRKYKVEEELGEGRRERGLKERR